MAITASYNWGLDVRTGHSCAAWRTRSASSNGIFRNTRDTAKRPRGSSPGST